MTHLERHCLETVQGDIDEGTSYRYWLNDAFIELLLCRVLRGVNIGGWGEEWIDRQVDR